METISQPDKNWQKILESQLRENYGKIVYSHKTQEKCADILTKRNNWLKNTQIFLSAIVTTGLLVKVFGGENWVLIISTVISTVQLALNAFLKEYKLGETIQRHNTSALELLEVREQYLSLLTDLKGGQIDSESAKSRRDKLLDKLLKTYKGSPRTFSKAYQDARKALQLNEELTFSDKEVDAFLPKELRKE